MDQGKKSSLDPIGDRLMAIFWRSAASSIGERCRRRVSLRLVPFLFFLYILAYIDRSNISVAMLGMQASPENGGLGLSSELIGLLSGIFFLGYWILEIPSTLSVERWGVRWVFVRILVLWGLTATVTGAVGTPAMGTAMSVAFGWLLDMHNPGNQLKVLRFFLGFFEGGLFPSVIVYLAYWFRTEDRAKAIAGFALGMPLSMVVGNSLSSWLIEVRWFGVVGWRWVFIVEGVLPILAGVATFFVLPNRPSEAGWLSDEEHGWLTAELDREHQQKQLARAHFGWRSHLLIVLLLTAVYFCQNITIYGVNFFMPKIMAQWLPSLPYTVRLWLGFAGKMSAKVSLARQEHAAAVLAVLPYLVGTVAMIFNGRHSDRTRERTFHAVVPLLLVSGGMFVVSQLGGHPRLAILVMIFVVGSGVFTHIPAFWPMPSMFLGATAAASAIGFINMTGNLGGFVGPVIAGYSAKENNMDAAIRNLSPYAAMGAAILIAMDFYRRSKTRQKT